MFNSDELNPHFYENQIHKTAFAICHNAIRRSSEPISQQFGGLKVENIVFVGGPDEYTPAPLDDMNASAILIFLFSKKNKLGETQSAPLLHLCKFGLVCAYCQLLQLRLWRIKNDLWKPEHPVFWMKNKSILTYNKLNYKFKKCGEAIGYNADQIKLHGLRSGGNIDLKMLGVNPNTRQIIAGWKDPKTRLKYEMKMEPQHLHQCLAADLGFSSTKILTGRVFEKIVSTRKDKLKRRKKKLVKELKKQKAKLRISKRISKRKSLRKRKCSWRERRKN